MHHLEIEGFRSWTPGRRGSDCILALVLSPISAEATTAVMADETPSLVDGNNDPELAAIFSFGPPEACPGSDCLNCLKAP